ncbi:MAG: HD domain-containing phosphohydrolase [Pseudomonadota bacterium]
MNGEANVLIVDDELGPRESLRMMLKPIFNVHAVDNGEEALRFIRQEPVNLVTLDLKMPGMPGIEVLKGIKEYNSDIEVIVLTGYGSMDTAVEALRCGALDYINKPFDVPQVEKIVRKGIEKNKNNISAMLQKAMGQTVDTMSSIVEVRDPYTFGHQQRVAKLALAIAEEMGLSKEQIETIRIAGLLHDIGKMYVPSEIMSKPGKLNASEMSMLKAHPQVGSDLLKTLELPWPICPIIAQHHERIDGSGYPNGLTEEDIAVEVKILSVADVVEAMASHRPYRPSLGIEKALEEILQNRGLLYDPQVVDACIKLFKEGDFVLD